MIFQEPMTSLSPVHTVGGQIAEAVELHQRAGKRQAMEFAIHMLAQVGIGNPRQRAQEYPHQFSGGMRQRAMIAMALSCNPSLLIADEPTTALDVTIQAQILELMQALQAEFKMAILMITHNLGVIAEMADRVAVMYMGKVVEMADAATIFAEPLHPYTVGLMRSIPRIGGKVNRRLAVIPGSRARPVQPAHGLHLLPTLPRPQTRRLRAGRPPSGSQPRPLGPLHAVLMADVLLEVNNLKKHFPIQSGLMRKVVGQVKAVDGVSFDIKEGETLGLVGESGCGKTTTGRLVLRAMKPTDGEVLLRRNGGMVDLTRLSRRQLKPIRKDVQIIFQDPFSSLSPRMTVLDIISEPLIIHGMRSADERRARVRQLLEMVGLRVQHMNRYPHAFSGGQRQRIGIARALALQPDSSCATSPSRPSTSPSRRRS